VLALLVLAVLNRKAIRDSAEDLVLGSEYERAAERDSTPARGGEALALPLTVDAANPLLTEPAIDLGPLIELPRASALADPPDEGPVLVATLDGRVHAVDLDTGTTEVVLDISDRITTGGEQGLLGLAVDPAGERVYANYTNDTGDTEIRSWAIDATGQPEPGDGVLHLKIGQPFDNHNGGHLVFGPDGAL
jgi:hypothetical protein